MNIVESVAGLLGKKAAELKLEDIQKTVPGARRMADEYQGRSLEHERKSLGLREKAFTPGGNPADQAAFLRQAKQEAALCDTVSKQAGIFIQQLGHLRALETTMQVVEEFKNVGMLSKNLDIRDWQKVMDEMAAEIQHSIQAMQKMQDVITGILPDTGKSDESPNKELEELFSRYNKATDPAEQDQIRAEIERKTALAI